MLSYPRNQEIAVWREWRYDNLASPGTTQLYDFQAAGYANGETLSATSGTKRKVTLTIVDQTGSYATVLQGGVAVTASTLYFTAYSTIASKPNCSLIVFNVPAVPGVYTCKAEIQGAGSQYYATHEWQISVT